MNKPTNRVAAASRQGGLIRSLVDAIPRVIFFREASDVYFGCNAALADLLGGPAVAILGNADHDLVSRERRTN